MTEVQVNRAELERGLSKIIDPELGRSITELKLIDNLKTEGGFVELEFHLTAPFCPPVFALKIASDIKAAVTSTKGVTGSMITLRGHYLADAVNKQVNKPVQPQA